MKLLILAGGSGTRLWPLSRMNQPKQVQPFFDNFTLLQHTWRRLSRSFRPKDIFVSTTLGNLPAVKKQLPSLLKNHLIVEPSSKNTGPAIALATKVISNLYPEEIIGTINSDHYIQNVPAYLKTLRRSADIIKKSPNSILLIGLKPTYPETGYGYIKVGQAVKGVKPAVQVRQFTEKPSKRLAVKYLAAGSYLWNSGIFFFKAQNLLDNLSTCAPDIYRFLQTAKLFNNKGYYTTQAKSFSKLKTIAFDYAVVEKFKDLLVHPADFDWVDVGNWLSVFKVINKTGRTNLVKGNYVGWESSGNLVYSLGGRLVATVGLKDMVVIDTKEALLVCPIDKAQSVKNLVAKLSKPDLMKYL
ncbi:MAG: mannose-1-phosphate guanylyltransferase [Patescibacteria group bacterium]